jgi:hypothetical protein
MLALTIFVFMNELKHHLLLIVYWDCIKVSESTQLLFHVSLLSAFVRFNNIFLTLTHRIDIICELSSTNQKKTLFLLND